MKTLTFLFFALVFALVFRSGPTYANENTLKNFETDGCTMFFDGPKDRPNLWRHCCVEHDLRYWYGGDSVDMKNTDLRLKACVKEVAGDTWANLIYLGVRTGHLSPIKNKTHWSWGWTNKRANSKLSKEESEYVIEELRRLPFDQEMIEKFIERNFKNNNVQI